MKHFSQDFYRQHTTVCFKNPYQCCKRAFKFIRKRKKKCKTGRDFFKATNFAHFNATPSLFTTLSSRFQMMTSEQSNTIVILKNRKQQQQKKKQTTGTKVNNRNKKPLLTQQNITSTNFFHIYSSRIKLEKSPTFLAIHSCR